MPSIQMNVFQFATYFVLGLVLALVVAANRQRGAGDGLPPRVTTSARRPADGASAIRGAESSGKRGGDLGPAHRRGRGVRLLASGLLAAMLLLGQQRTADKPPSLAVETADPEGLPEANGAAAADGVPQAPCENAVVNRERGRGCSACPAP